MEDVDPAGGALGHIFTALNAISTQGTLEFLFYGVTVKPQHAVRRISQCVKHAVVAFFFIGRIHSCLKLQFLLTVVQ